MIKKHEVIVKFGTHDTDTVSLVLRVYVLGLLDIL